MKKVELLSPVGNMESLYQAIGNGCDAVYLGGKKFGARAFASNFDNEEMISAIKYCHLYGVKIYVTVNTLIHDDEMEDALEYLKFLYLNGVDAVIIQDIGLINLTRKYLSNLTLHASTQMHNINSDGLKMIENMGLTRAVLARELSLNDIAKLDTNLELECFIHGALCISYSGQCLFSSMVMNRSGNRGECSGMCRLPYRLVEDNQRINSNDKYILSPKEFITIDKLPELLDLNKITSLKIEGRMKSPTYVGFVTRLYREAIDAYYASKKYLITNENLKKLMSIFNRGFTNGHMFNNKTEDLMNTKSPNHIGYKIGEVIEVNNKRIKIKLIDELNQEDGIRFSNGLGMNANFIYKNDLLVSGGTANDIIEVDNKVGLEELGELLKTSDAKLIKELKIVPERKIPIEIELNSFVGEKLKLTITDGTNKVSKESIIVEEAKNSPTSKDRIIEQLEKLGDTPFISKSTTINMDENIFLPIKVLNELRRDLTTELITIRENINKDNKEIKEIKEIIYNRVLCPKDKKKISCVVRNMDQLNACIEEKVDIIYTSDKELFEEYKNKCNLYYRTDRIINNHNDNYDKLLVGELGSLNKYNGLITTDYFMNAYNADTTNYYLNNKATTVTLSPELSIENYEKLIFNYKKHYNNIPSVELMVYATLELMVMKHCPVNKCSKCKDHKYALEDRNGEIYPIDNNCSKTIIYNYRPINIIDNLTNNLLENVSVFRIDLLNETKNKTKEIIKNIKNVLNNL